MVHTCRDKAYGTCRTLSLCLLIQSYRAKVSTLALAVHVFVLRTFTVRYGENRKDMSKMKRDTCRKWLQISTDIMLIISSLLPRQRVSRRHPFLFWRDEAASIHHRRSSLTVIVHLLRLAHSLSPSSITYIRFIYHSFNQYNTTTMTGSSNGNGNGSARVGTDRVKQGLAQMLKGGVIVSSVFSCCWCLYLLSIIIYRTEPCMM